MAKDRRKSFVTYPDDYFTGSQVKVYFGGLWVDDVATIQYQTSQSKTPLFGYNDHQFRAVAKGQFMVNGSFTIAFKEVGYLNIIMSTIRDHNSGLNNLLNTQKLSGGQSKFMRYIAQGLTIEEAIDQANGANIDLANTYEGSNGKGDFEDIAEIMEDSIWGKEVAENQTSIKRNIVRSDELDYYNVTKSHRKNDMSIDRDGFDILLTFGNYTGDDNPEHTMMSINDVHITGESMIMTPGGEPIGVTYNFFARGLNERVSNFREYIDEKKSEDAKSQAEEALRQLSLGLVEVNSIVIKIPKAASYETNPPGSAVQNVEILIPDLIKLWIANKGSSDNVSFEVQGDKILAKNGQETTIVSSIWNSLRDDRDFKKTIFNSLKNLGYTGELIDSVSYGMVHASATVTTGNGDTILPGSVILIDFYDGKLNEGVSYNLDLTIQSDFIYRTGVQSALSAQEAQAAYKTAESSRPGEFGLPQEVQAKLDEISVSAAKGVKDNTLSSPGELINEFINTNNIQFNNSELNNDESTGSKVIEAVIEQEAIPLDITEIEFPAITLDSATEQSLDNALTEESNQIPIDILDLNFNNSVIDSAVTSLFDNKEVPLISEKVVRAAKEVTINSIRTEPVNIIDRNILEEIDTLQTVKSEPKLIVSPDDVSIKTNKIVNNIKNIENILPDNVPNLGVLTGDISGKTIKGALVVLSPIVSDEEAGFDIAIKAISTAIAQAEEIEARGLGTSITSEALKLEINLDAIATFVLSLNKGKKIDSVFEVTRNVFSMKKALKMIKSSGLGSFTKEDIAEIDRLTKAIQDAEQS